MARPLHLVRRFLGSLSPRRLDPVDDEWVCGNLSTGEIGLWNRMSRPDRKHAAGVARTVDDLLGGAEPAVIAAAALHDVGKVESGFGTFARSWITALAAVVGRERLVSRGDRVAVYLTHDRVGADLLAAAGSAPLTVAWAREHHLSPERWTLPRHVADALSAADDD